MREKRTEAIAKAKLEALGDSCRTPSPPSVSETFVDVINALKTNDEEKAVGLIHALSREELNKVDVDGKTAAHVALVHHALKAIGALKHKGISVHRAITSVKQIQNVSFLDVIKRIDIDEDETKACALINRLDKFELSRFDERGLTIAHYATLNRFHNALLALKMKGVNLHTKGQNAKYFPIDIALNDCFHATESNPEAFNTYFATYIFMKKLGAGRGVLHQLPTRKAMSISTSPKKPERERLSEKLKGAAKSSLGHEVMLNPLSSVKEKWNLNMAKEVFK